MSRESRQSPTDAAILSSLESTIEVSDDTRDRQSLLTAVFMGSSR